MSFELNNPMNAAHIANCPLCDEPSKKVISFHGIVWAPTSGGYK